MARIAPIAENDLSPSVKVAFERNLNGYDIDEYLLDYLPVPGYL
jgi:hypothetical protein